MQQNPFEFLRMLQKINVKVSRNICQWNHTVISAKQQRVEKAHKTMLANLQSEISTGNINVAINDFFEATKHITKNSIKFVESVNVNSPSSHDNINFCDLYVQESEYNLSRTTKQNKEKLATLTITLSPLEDSPSQFVRKLVKISNTIPSTVHQATLCFKEMYDNLYFNHYTVSGNHADFLYKNDLLYIRDLGSVGGTKINNRKIGRVGVEWCPQILKNGDHLQLGEIVMAVSWCTEKKPTTSTTPTNKRKTIVTVELLNNMHIPLRTIEMYQNVKYHIGKSIKTDPPAEGNIRIYATRLSHKQASIIISKGVLHIIPTTNYVPTFVNNTAIHSKTPIYNSDVVTFGYNYAPHIMLRFTYLEDIDPTDMPSITIEPVPNIGTLFNNRNVHFDEKHEIIVGRKKASFLFNFN